MTNYVTTYFRFEEDRQLLLLKRTTLTRTHPTALLFRPHSPPYAHTLTTNKSFPTPTLHRITINIIMT